MTSQSDILENLKAVIAEVVPVKDSNVDWLSRHRPSVAFACCIGAGPWKIGRRRNVQQSFLEALAGDDLSSPKALNRLVQKCQLGWQIQWFVRVNRALKKHGVMFDSAFNPAPKNPATLNFAFSKCITSSPKMPKVIALFKRDFLFQPCFPIDRHVRAFLVDHQLPDDAVQIEQAFATLGLNPSGYSRAIFNSKTSNPLLEPTRK